MQFRIETQEQTEELGRLLGEVALPGDIICLEGDLGAGKTTLTQAIARGLGVPETTCVNSPSFAILHEYEGRIPLYHFDFYRLGDSAEVEEQGFADYFELQGLCVIEWPQLAEDALPVSRLQLALSLELDAVPSAEGHPPRRVQVEGTLHHPDFLSLFSRRLQMAGIVL